ncbi:MAG: chromate efflux transporter [Hydrogenophaga sp.]|uniref:chromate efflux transporter n=3 Tax=Hydrogenophaga sp. TaxID=1904254 RepID=UPI000ED8FA5F|nr:chromate efflux transporter [Hydrogenophaga sp.]MDD3785996.1 chromate efflux transporter [Hydrogenophaga sp.]HAJ11115.1 chromate ion family chromate transporter [Comamonadaceae bacterium]
MKSRPPARPPVHAAAGSAGEVFTAFLRLGLTSFGGPVAHLAYFRREFVERRAWMNESQFAQLLALCQFLPGPASSQLGASIGLLRAGWAGALAAFLAFTLPSAVLLFALAAWLPSVSGPVGDAALHGLKLVALAVVAQAVLGMARPLCPDLSRRAVAVAAAALVLTAGQTGVQLLAVALGAVAGLVLCRGVPAVPGAGLPTLRHGPALGGALLAVFALLLVGLPLLAAAHGGAGLLSVIDAFYRAGALVFGGGHVVLPWLEAAVVGPGWVSTDDFLAGYGAAQAVPGPMFTLAAYLGARLPGSAGGIVGASVALGAIFLPGLLLVTGVLPLWRAVAGRAVAARAIAGANAAVVGLLGAALYDPVWTGAVRGPMDIAIALAGVALLVVGRVAPLLVVAWCVAASVVGAFWS